MGTQAALLALLTLSIGCALEGDPDGARGDELAPAPHASALPIVVIETDDAVDDYAAIQARGKATRTKAHASLLAPGLAPDGRAYPREPFAVEVRTRGASSIRNPKNGLDLKVVDPKGERDPIALIGLGETSSWVLNAPYLDKTMMRNSIGLAIARALDLVGSPTQHVEVYVNDEYLGIYVLMPKIGEELDCKDGEAAEPGTCIPDRPSLGHEPIGGYLLSRDGTPDEADAYFLGPLSGLPFSFVHPEPGKAKHVEAGTYAKAEATVAAIEARLCAPDFADPTTGYADLIDVDSFVDYFLVRELFGDLDGFRRSMYFYVDDTGKLKMGPAWDFDSGSGGVIGKTVERFAKPDREWALQFSFADLFELLGIRDPQPTLGWFKRLLQDPAFVARVQARWTYLRDEVLGLVPVTPASACDLAYDVPKLGARIDAEVHAMTSGCGQELADLDVPLGQVPGACAIKRNFTRWDQLGRESPGKDHRDSGDRFFDEGPAYVNARARANCDVPSKRFYRDTYADFVTDWRAWLTDRAVWMDARMPHLGEDFADTRCRLDR
jgi:hypothetical protein